MRIIHSFIKYPHLTHLKYVANIACYILSCLYIKRHEGFQAILYADKETIQTMKSIGASYDEYHEISSINYPHSNIYAYPKFLAMQHEPLGSIHIDGDVFIWGEPLKNILQFNNYDVICQNIETYNNMRAKISWDVAQCECSNMNYPSFAKRECQSMINCGIIGINNQILKDNYFKIYWEMLEQYKTKYKQCKGVPDIIFEQQFLLDYCNHNNYRIKTVLDEDNLFLSAKDIGYLHLIGDSKYKYKNIKKVIDRIKREDIVVFNNLKEFVKKLTK